MNLWSVRVPGVILAATFVFGLAPSAFAGSSVVAGDSCGIFLGSNRAFFLINENTTGATIAVNATFGPSGAALDPIPADFDNNGSDTFAVYRHVTGQFLLKNSNVGGAADQVVRFGGKDRQSPANPLIGLSGDFNGNGSAGIGLYDPDASTFTLQFSPSDGGMVDASFRLGNGGQGLLPIVGDFNGDDTDTVGVYSPTTGQFTFKAANTQGAAVTTIRFGGTNTTNLPISGDFNNDSTDTVAFYIPGAKTFITAGSNVDGGGTVSTFKFGGTDASIVPICGDWDGV